MKYLLMLGWGAWGLSAASLVAGLMANVVFRHRQRVRVAALAPDNLTLSDMRVLVMRDSRDPIERHHDGMTVLWEVAARVVAGAILLFFTLA